MWHCREEFVAAFRRYADRTGLFIPSAAPLPAGRRGRIALTLKDGGVMIEGDAEILQSSAKATMLHGRPGMTGKFLAPDEPSKTVIGELEKARLAMKPAPPSVAPRPARVPAEPRPIVPPAGGRIDAANALAECVVIGDVSTLTETAGCGSPARSSACPRFRPSARHGRSPQRSHRTWRAPHAPRPRRPHLAPKTPTAPPNPAPRPVATPKLTSIGFPIIEKLPATTESGKVPESTMFTTHGATTAPSAPPAVSNVKTDDEALALDAFQGGEVVLLIPRAPFKCPPAPYEAAMLLQADFSRRGISAKTQLSVYTVEGAPMATAGPQMGAMVREQLAGRGIGF